MARRNVMTPKLITVTEYLRRKELRKHTLFVIGPDYSGYVVDGNIIARDEFDGRYPLPVSLVENNTANSDRTKDYLK